MERSYSIRLSKENVERKQELRKSKGDSLVLAAFKGAECGKEAAALESKGDELGHVIFEGEE